MPKLKFDLPAPLDSATAYDRVKNLLSGDNDFKKLDPKVVCKFDDTKKCCSLAGSQFKADLQVSPQKNSSGTVINIEVEIPFALMLFKGKIQEAIEKNLKKIL